MPANKSDKPVAKVRLNKFISAAGVCSRRKADELIAGGYVRLNGKITRELGIQVDPKNDEVIVKGKRIRTSETKIYLAVNKPVQMLTTMSDPQGRPTIAEIIKPLRVRLFPVGRLDWDSEGLIIMTNDGDFANEVMHPKHGVTKTYVVKLDGSPSENDLKKLVHGVTLADGKAKALRCEKMASRGSENYDWVRIVINEGRNRQVRRMFAKIGYDVKKLQRVSIGRLSLGALPKGGYRILTPVEVKKIFQVEDNRPRKSADAAEGGGPREEGGEQSRPSRGGKRPPKRDTPRGRKPKDDYNDDSTDYESFEGYDD